MSYQGRFPLYAHQKQCLDKMRGQEAFAMLMAMRTGKTCTILTEYGANEDDGFCRDLLVLAPAGSYRNWAIDKGPTQPSELRKHLSEDLFERAVTATWISGSAPGKRKVEALLRVRERPRIFVVNVEALSSVEAAREAVLTFLQGRKATIVIDESTKIKTPDAARTKFITELRKLAPLRRIMTGLITPRSPLDLFSQFFFLDPKILGHWSYYTFRNRYAIVQDIPVGEWIVDPRTGVPTRRTAKVVVAYRNTEELQGIIAPHSFRCLLKDCYDVPPKLYLFREVEMTPEQKKIYKGLLEDAEAELENGDYISAGQMVVNILRRQEVLCGQAKDEQGNVHEIPENRTKALLDILEEYEGKAIIWCTYDLNIRKVSATLAKEYGEKAVARFWGGNRTTRHEDEQRFLTDPDCRFMVATPAAGGMGNTWTNADLTVYYSNSDNLEHRDQSEERTQGVGKTQFCTYVDIMVPGTIDEKIIKSLRAKIDLATAIMGDGYREWLV